MGVDTSELLRLLQNDLQQSDVEIQLSAVKRLGKLAKVLGPELTRGELLTFLFEMTCIENPEDKAADEVLFNMSKQLGEFVPLVGGAEFGGAIIAPLAEIATTEETLVRDAAVAAMNKIFEVCPSDDASSSDVAMRTIRRLSGDSNEPIWFTSKMSACGIFASAFNKLANAQKAEALEIFKKHCADELPMVRRAAAKALTPLSAILQTADEVVEVYELWNKLCGDVYDNVRLLAALAIAELIKKLPTTSHEEAVSTFQSICEDKSWRVRLSLAKVFPSVIETVGEELAVSTLVNSFVALLQDHEAEVRGVACKAISNVCGVVGGEVFNGSVVPVLAELSADTAHDPELKVRTPLVQELTRLPSSITQDEAAQSVLPILSNCVTDANGQVMPPGLGPGPADLQLMILRELSMGSEDSQDNTTNVVSGVQRPWMRSRGNAEEREALVNIMVHGLEASFLEGLLSDVNWRVREAAVLCVPRLVAVRGGDFFLESLEVPFYKMIEDKVAAVRRATGQCLGDLSRQLGSDHTAAKILPRLRSSATGNNYQLRISAVEALGWLCTENAGADVLEEVAAALSAACSDGVANVRLAGVGSLAKLAKVASEEVLQSSVVPQVTELLQDDDEDVKHMANLILETTSA